MNKQSFNNISFTEAINRTDYARNVKDIIASLILEIFSDGNYIIQSIFQLKNNSNLIVEKLARNTPYYNINIVLMFYACDENHRKIMVRELSGKEIMNDLI